MRELLAEFVAEQETLDRVVAALSAEAWDRPSPAAGWSLRDCVVHLAEVDAAAVRTIAEGRFPGLSGQADGGPRTRAMVDAQGKSAAQVLDWWRQARARLVALAAPLDAKARLPWAGPPMSARSFITARLMEYWSHGLDIHDVAGVTPLDTDRLRHVAHLGYVTRAFAYRNRDLPPPETPLYVELTAPSGAVWTWGPPEAAERITGPAGDFCRVVTQRIHPLDTMLRTEGVAAAEYLHIAQAFAGPPGAGRPPRSAER